MIEGMIDVQLFTRLYEVFPEAFNAWKECETREYESGPFGIEETVTGTRRFSCAESILWTAQRYTYGGKDIDGALSYIDTYKLKKNQRKALWNFPLR